MAPPGLVVSKLGVQASAGTDTVRGVLCLKVSVSDGLFGTQPPRILATQQPDSLQVERVESEAPSRWAVSADLADLVAKRRRGEAGISLGTFCW
jgi:hypothetical protein